MKNIVSFALLLMVAVIPQLASADNNVELAASLQPEIGRAYPGGPLANLVEPGTSYRISLFGGARVPRISWLGGVGLGVDFTYSAHDSKAGEPGAKYNRYEWDWLFIPVSFADLIVVTPGVAWLVSDVRLPSLGIEDTSIRPAGVIGLGVRYPLLPHFYVCLDGRAEWAFSDHQRTVTGDSINIVGSFYSWWAGFRVSI